MANTPTQIKSEVVYIEDLLEQIGAGELRVPRFQRGFVWRPNDMLQLFDSIYKGYPIGSLLVWDTSASVASLDMIGDRPVPPAPRRPVKFVLDGHQRLSTLFGVLRLPADAEHTALVANWRWSVWFDLRRKEFVHTVGRDPEPYYFPLRSLLKTVDFLAASRALLEAIPNAQSLIAEAERLAQIIKRYRVPITAVVGGDIDDAVETFSRLNNRGRDISADEMVSALTYQDDFNLSNRIDDIIETLKPYGFDSIGREILFRAIVAIAGLDIYDTKWAALASKLKERLAEAVGHAATALESAAAHMRDEWSVPGARFLPYAQQLVMLATFFHCSTAVSEAQGARLTRWFWGTSANGWFAGANTSQIKSALASMREFAAGTLDALDEMLVPPARPFPKRFDLHSARTRTLLLTLVAMQPQALDGDLVDARKLLADEGSRAIARVFSGIEPALSGHPANRLIVGAEAAVRVRDKLKALSLTTPPALRSSVLTSHGISAAAFEALRADDAPTFIRLRERSLLAHERDFLLRHQIVVPESASNDDASDTD